MSSAVMCHPGFLFATLVVQLAKTNAAKIPSLYARRRGSDDGGGDDSDPCGDDNGCPSSSQPSGAKTTSTSSSPTSVAMSSSSSVPTGSQSSTTAASSSTTPSAISQINSNLTHPSITTGGIVGSVLGSLIILGLVLMFVAQCVNRRRKARKRPQGFVPSTFFTHSPNEPQTPVTEMSQTQSSPIISSAVASRAIMNPPPHYPHSYSTSPTNTTSTSLSSAPLLPAPSVASMTQTRSIASSSARRTSVSYTDASSHHELLQPLPSPYDTTTLSSWTMNHAATGLGGVSFANTGTSVGSEPTGLHRSLTAFQKSLEAEDRKGNEIDEGKQVITHDPPPKYDA